MCNTLPLADGDESEFGFAVRLCADFGPCIATLFQRGEDAPADPATKLFSAFAPAVVAVVEAQYFDMDYRSEFTATHETAFSVREIQTARVHFFGGGDASDGAPLHTLVNERRQSYRGYVIVRPQYAGMIGRSLVPPDGEMPALAEFTTRSRHVRTAVREHVNLFGIPLNTVGVPFMEQDGHLLRCVHVSAWICHYTAVLRGLVPRRPSAEFHAAQDSSGVYGRPYPSAGLTSWDLAKVLRNVGLPPEVIDWSDLEPERQPQWYDRSELWEAVPVDGKMASEAQSIWYAENLTATVCRYLNSGMPCILGDDGTQHTFVIHGYVRAEDLISETAAQSEAASAHSDVVAFLVGDDQKGPFTLVWVKNLVDPADARRNKVVVVPLPHGLWMSGGHAEKKGAAVFRKLVGNRLAQIAAWAKIHDLPDDVVDAHRQALSAVVKGVESTGGGPLAVRSYAATGIDVKMGLARQLGKDPANAAAVRTVGYTAMPKFVWVVEIIDRTLRAQRKPAVIGTIVLDASVPADSSLPARAWDDSDILLVHVPGQISRIRQDPLDNKRWGPTGLRPYESGRWGHDGQSKNTSPSRVVGRAKLALAGR